MRAQRWVAETAVWTEDVSAAHVVDAETALVLNDGQYVAREENVDAKELAM